MTHPFTQRQLGEILVDKNYVEQEMITEALSQGSGNLGEKLITMQAITAEQLAEALAEQSNMEYVSLEGNRIASELFKYIPAARAYELGVVPHEVVNGNLKVAISDPFDLSLVDKLEQLSPIPVQLVISSAQAIKKSLKHSETTTEVLKDVSEEFKLEMVKESEDGREQTVSLDNLGDDVGPVAKLINTILVTALQKRASDVHLEIYESGIVTKYRIDGVLYPATEVLDNSYYAAMVSRLKVMAELDIAEKRVPQDGRFKLRMNEHDIDFRISIIPSVFGEDVVIRILDKASVGGGLKRLDLDSLGIDAEVLKKFRKSVHEPYGMVLITGPTGSGKTTTLYAALSELNSGEEKIITIEDPVEYQLDGIVQIPVNEKKNLTFARGLRSILRHDPDKIMVGEIRDSDTVQIAVQSALTGHLVFTTVHANNVFDVIGRFSHMGVDVYAFVSALNSVMAQRLVRQVCTECRHTVKIDRGFLERSGLDPKQYAKQVWYEGKGCQVCSGTGYLGRTAITEYLDLSPNIREMIIDRRPLSELQSAAIKEGMITLRQSVISKAVAGETTLREANRVTFVD